MLEWLFTGNSEALREVRAALLASRRRGDGGLVADVEAAVAAAPAQAITFDSAGLATVHGAGRTFAGGAFATPSIAELRQRLTAPSKRTPGGRRVRLSALAGADPLTDIGSLQAVARDALFQVASQFNCLEATGPHVAAVKSYPGDPTQGPRAAYSAFPGTLVRHYAAPAAGSRFMQATGGPQLDLLEAALPAAAGRVRSGYLRAGDITDPAAAAEALEARFEHIRVGVHDAVEVVFGHDYYGQVDGQPRIAQVFTSTLAAGGYSRDVPIEGAFERICRQLLRAAYLGTLLAAAGLGRRTAVLTLIGGGVFANPHPLIWDAIAWAVDEADRACPSELHAVVNCHTGMTSRDRTLAIVRAHGGVLVEVAHGDVQTSA